MKAPTHIELADHRSSLVEAVLCLLERQLPSVIAYVWPEQHRILFRTGDGRTGDVEVIVNWDVPVTQNAAGENSAPVPTESSSQL